MRDSELEESAIIAIWGEHLGELGCIMEGKPIQV
jgi:hypothetical protein